MIDIKPFKDKYQSAIAPDTKAPYLFLSQWLVDYANEFGDFMNTPESLTKESLASFYAVKPASVYHLDDYIIPAGGWRNFNDFFAREVKKGARPIASPTDPSVVVSPADAVWDGSWPVDNADDVTTFVTSKGIPWPIQTLLADSEYANHFQGGTFTHSFLNTTDYHRQHAPVAGKVLEAKVIQGLCYLEVVSEPAANGPVLSMRRKLDAPDDPGYQFIQSRGLVIIESEIGLVAVLPIGMAQVSSVVLTVAKGATLEKGEEISYFQLGGSDIVMVFQAGANVKFPGIEPGKVHFNQGKRLATATPMVGELKKY